MRVLIDTNVIVDVLQNRAPWFADGQQIFLAAANQIITGCITAKQAADIYYFSRKQFRGEDFVDDKARKIIVGLYSIFELLDKKAVDCKNALGLSNNDYEDAILISTAARENVDCIVTRNIEHFRSCTNIPVYAPDAFVNHEL